MKLNNLLEATDYFKKADNIEIDPDRDGSYDLADKLLPTLLKIAYVNLHHDRDKHIKTHGEHDPDDEDSFKFDFDRERLKLEFHDLVRHLQGRLESFSDSDLDEAIVSLKDQFKTPLEK